MTRRILRVVLVVQLAAVTLFGSLAVFRVFTWAPIDERAHYAFIEELARDGRTPVLEDLVSPDVQAVTDRTYPEPSPISPAEAGFVGKQAEAFQPPLYYALAVPLYAVGGDVTRRVHVLRAFDLALLLCAALLLIALSREVFGHRWELPAVTGLAVVTWPGSVVRGVTVSNAALERPLVVLFLLAFWRAWRGAGSASGGPALVAASGLLAACLLTRLTLVCLAPLLLLAAWRHLQRRQRSRRALATVGLALAIPAVCLAPWIASNLDRYDAPTATAAAFDQQRPLFGYPSYSIGDLPALNGQLLSAVSAQEYPHADEPPPVRLVASATLAVFIALTLAALLARPSLLRRPEALLTLPVAVCWLALNVTAVREDVDVFVPRYLYPMLAPAALVVGAGWRAALATRVSAERADRVASCAAVGFAALSAAMLVATARHF